MGKSSFPTLLLGGYITAGASVTLERDTCWDNVWAHLLQPVLEKPNELIPKKRRSIIFREFDRYIDADISNGFVMSVFWTYQSTQARSPPQVLAHQQVRESRTHPWDKYVSLSRTSLQSSSHTWYFHAVCVCNKSRCVSGAAAALLQGSKLSGDSKLGPHRTLNNVHRSARFHRNMRKKRWPFNTEEHNRQRKERLT